MENDEVIYTKEKAHSINLCTLLSITDTKQCKILTITTGKRLLPLSNERLSLSP